MEDELCYLWARAVPKIWYETIDQFLRSYGLCPLVTEPCLYVLKKDGKIILSVLLYVDDILYAGSKAALDDFENAMQQKFQIKHTVQATSYLGIDIAQHPQHVTLSQPKYIADAVERFGLINAKPVRTPIVVNKPETTAASRR